MTARGDGRRQDGAGPLDAGEAPARRAVVGSLGEGLLEIGVFPAFADDVLGKGFGGDAANLAVMAARLGANARLLTRIGDDAAGRLLRAFWAGAGVDLGWVETEKGGATGLYVHERKEGGGHAFSYHRAGSAASRLSPADVVQRPLDELDVLHVTGVTLAISASAATAAEAAVQRARTAEVAVSFAVNFRSQLDPDRARLAEMARRADILFCSLEDAHGLFGVQRPGDLLDALGPREGETVITQGEAEAWLVTAAGVRRVRPPSVHVLDTAGAGDALAGAYLASRFSGADPETALANGVVAAALSCRAAGCARSYPSAREVTAAAAMLRPLGAEVRR